MISRRQMIVATAAVSALPGFARASNFPERLVRLVAMIGPGTATDILARSIAANMSKQWNSSVIVENKVGAGGTIGTDFVAKSAADGYNVLVTNGGHYSSAALYKNLPYDPQADLMPVAQFAQSALILYVPPDSPFRTFQDIVAEARKRPGKLSYSHAGTGSASHLAGALMCSMAGVNIQHVPYKSSAQAVLDVASGVLEMGMHGMSAATPLIESGKIRPIAVTSLKRSQILPNVPTLNEAGIQGYELISPIFALVRAGTPEPIVGSLASAITNAAGTREFAESCRSQGLDVEILGTAALRASMPAHFAKWKKLVEMSGVTAA